MIKKSRKKSKQNNIYYDKYHDKYKVQIGIDGKDVTFGSYKTRTEAEKRLHEVMREIKYRLPE